jgi:hypothetical protein
MNNSIMQELKRHVIDLISEGRINDENLDDAHHIAFNEDYYIIGYYQADEWLKKHDVTPWEAIDYWIKQEAFHFGEVQCMTKNINSESVVNSIVFFAGFEIDIESIYNTIKEL